MFSTIKNVMKWILKEGGCSGDAVAGCSRQSRNFRYDCENFARIAKISQS